MIDKFSLPQLKVIEKCADEMIASCLRLACNPYEHSIFEDICEIYEDGNLIIMEELTDAVSRWEEIKEYPERGLKKLKAMDLVLLKWVLTDMIEDKSLGKTKNQLVGRIEQLISLQSINCN